MDCGYYELNITHEEFNHIAQGLAFYILDNDRFIETGMAEYTEQERADQVSFSRELEILLANIEAQIEQQMKEHDNDE